MKDRDRNASHEQLVRDEAIKGSSDRGFGIVFAVVFLIVGLFPLLSSGAVRLWALAIAAAFAVVAFAAPRLLAPLNRVWTKFGLLLAGVVNPIIMALLFYAVVMPIGLLMRLTGKKPLRLQFEPESRSYWIDRRPPGPAPETMKNQF